MVHSGFHGTAAALRHPTRRRQRAVPARAPPRPPPPGRRTARRSRRGCSGRRSTGARRAGIRGHRSGRSGGCCAGGHRTGAFPAADRSYQVMVASSALPRPMTPPTGSGPAMPEVGEQPVTVGQRQGVLVMRPYPQVGRTAPARSGSDSGTRSRRSRGRASGGRGSGPGPSRRPGRGGARRSSPAGGRTAGPARAGRRRCGRWRRSRPGAGRSRCRIRPAAGSGAERTERSASGSWSRWIRRRHDDADARSEPDRSGLSCLHCSTSFDERLDDCRSG